MDKSPAQESELTSVRENVLRSQFRPTFPSCLRKSQYRTTGSQACRTCNGVIIYACISRQQQNGSLQTACSDCLTGYFSGSSGQLLALSTRQGSHSIRLSHINRCMLALSSSERMRLLSRMPRG